MIFVQYTVGYIFSAMTVYLVYGYLAEGDGVMSKAWAVVKRDFFDLMSLAAASTAVNLLKNAIKGKGKSGGRNMLAGLIDTVWTEAAFLILPAMVIEDINLKNALKRAGSIIKNNLLLVGISTVGVKAVNGLIGFLLGALGIGLGFGVGFGIITITNTSTFGLITGIGLGVYHCRHLHHGRHGRHLLHLHRLPHLPVPVGARRGKGPGHRQHRPGAGPRSAGGGVEPIIPP